MLDRSGRYNQKIEDPGVCGSFYFKNAASPQVMAVARKRQEAFLKFQDMDVGNVELRYFPAPIFPHGCPGGCCSDVQGPAGFGLHINNGA